MSDILADLTIALDNALYKGGFLVRNDGEAEQIAKIALATIEAAGFEIVKRDRTDGPGSGFSDIDGAIASQIEAAPDIAKALEKCVEHLRCVRLGYSSISPEDLARAALAKAKGGAP